LSLRSICAVAQAEDIEQPTGKNDFEREKIRQARKAEKAAERKKEATKGAEVEIENFGVRE
jgi:hypothetical protein